MSNADLFNHMYGYDEKIDFSGLEHCIANDDPDDPNLVEPLQGTFFMNRICFEIIRASKVPTNFNVTKKYYAVPCDNYTTNDFINFTQKDLSIYEDILPRKFHSNRKYQILEAALNSKTDHKFLNFYEDLVNFYSSTRVDKIFRYIELNEFLEHGRSDETLEEFLENYAPLDELCKNFKYQDYGIVSEKLYPGNNVPLFFQFGQNASKRARKLFLDLNKDQISKVFLERAENKSYHVTRYESNTLGYIETFVKNAFDEPVKIDAYTQVEIGNIITQRVLGDSEYWASYVERNSNSFRKSKLSNMIQDIAKSYSKDIVTDKVFLTNFSYFIQKGGIDDLDAKEILAVLAGYKNPNLWCKIKQGQDVRNVVTYKIQQDELDPKALAKLIAYIIDKNDYPFSIPNDFNWGLINIDSPVEWIYGSLVTLKSKSGRREVMNLMD